jgi:AraC-like DNA-binding protein
MSPLVGPSRPPLFQRGLYSDAFEFQPFPATKLAHVDGRARCRWAKNHSAPRISAGGFPTVIMPTNANPLLSRFAPRAGLVILRQTFVRRCHGGNCLCRGSRMSNGTASALNSEQDLASIPMAQGGLSRLAIARLKGAGVPVAPLLKRVGLTPELIDEPKERLSVRSQIALLDEAAIALKDDCLGFTLARDFDLREIGLLYYVMASSQTLGEALKRLARYSKVTNEALVFGYREGNRLVISLSYSGVPRHSDRHQIEFCMFAALRICRMLTGRNLVPQHFSMSHYRSEGTSEMARFVGTKLEFSADADEFALNIDARELPLIHSDTYLNDLLLKYCQAALADRRGDKSQLRTRVENAISSLLPHGRVLVEDVARSLGMSERTLARKLSDEGLNFTEILQQLRRDLAVRYLDDRKLHVSKIAWLLGFHEVSAFTHTFKRWTGMTPSQMRTTAS